MSSTLGSSTSTGWNRRSSAGSFSMCWRYSSSVVAPIARSSPRASIGFSMLPASIAPSAAPAPTIVCSSSMKVMISPSLSAISFSTAFRRSSNSPRYFAPASIEPRSSAISRLFFSESARRRRRCAARAPRRSRSCRRPARRSAPGCSWCAARAPGSCGGSPRHVRSPGSSLPPRAAAVRSRPYFSSDWKVSSGFWFVTRWRPRTSASAPSIASRVRPASSRIRAAR